MQKAIILLSGGLDSATCLALAQSQGFASYALSFSYGQRHTVELEAAARVAKHMQAVHHEVIQLDTKPFQRSALTDINQEIPDFNNSQNIPVTYVPARNTVFLAMALAYAESIEANAIFIGASSIDYSHYPDCRPAFIEAFQALATVATKTGVEGNPIAIQAPLQFLSKAETIALGTRLQVPYELTVSCYQSTPEGAACGSCDSCTFRKRGFNAAGVPDPTLYKKQ